MMVGLPQSNQEWVRSIRDMAVQYVNSAHPHEVFIQWLTDLGPFSDEVSLIKKHAQSELSLMKMLTQISRSLLKIYDREFLEFCQDFGFLREPNGQKSHYHQLSKDKFKLEVSDSS